MNTRHLILPLLAASLTLPASAAVLFSDDFESYTVGNDLRSTTNWANGASNANNIESLTVRDEGTSTAFGTPNQYVEIVDDTTNRALEIRSDAGSGTGSRFEETYDSLSQFAFDFYVPTNALASGSLIFGYTHTGRLNSAEGVARFTIGQGSVGGVSGGTTSFDLDSAYRAFYVFNDTLSAQSYNGETIVAGGTALWLQKAGEAMFFAGAGSANDTVDRNSDGYYIGFTTFTSTITETLVDNVELSVVPEPTTTLLGALGMLALLRRRRA